MTFEEQIRALLGLENTNIGEAPMDIDDCQWIVPTPGRSDIHFNKDYYNYQACRLYFRGMNQKEVRERANQAYKTLQSYEGSNFVIILRGFPTYVGRDDNYRVVYRFEVEYQSGGN